jgi:hypothetical protein
MAVVPYFFWMASIAAATPTISVVSFLGGIFVSFF